MSKIESALREFVNDIEGTGGLALDDLCHEVPVASPDWPDLAVTYIHACEALGRLPSRVDNEE
jgi:hypothetical protein